MSQLASQTWLHVVRQNELYVVEECLDRWRESLKGRDVDAVVRYLNADI